MQHGSDSAAISILVLFFVQLILFRIMAAQRTRLVFALLIFAACGIVQAGMLYQAVSNKITGSLCAAACLALLGYFLSLILMNKLGRLPFIRRIAGLNAIDEAVGRATEMGRPILMVPGIGSISSDATQTIPTLNALSIFSYIARTIAQFGTPSIMATADPVVTGVAEETLREAYQVAGKPELFNADDVRFLSDRQFAFASGVAGLSSRERPAAAFYFGTFFAESLIIAEIGQRVGAVQIAGTNSLLQLPFFIATCDYVLIGDEFYAASAYISRDPTLLGSIVGQDYCKIVIVGLILAGVLAITVSVFVTHSPMLTFLLNLFKA